MLILSLSGGVDEFGGVKKLEFLKQSPPKQLQPKTNWKSSGFVSWLPSGQRTPSEESHQLSGLWRWNGKGNGCPDTPLAKVRGRRKSLWYWEEKDAINSLLLIKSWIYPSWTHQGNKKKDLKDSTINKQKLPEIFMNNDTQKYLKICIRMKTPFDDQQLHERIWFQNILWSFLIIWVIF